MAWKQTYGYNNNDYYYYYFHMQGCHKIIHVPTDNAAKRSANRAFLPHYSEACTAQEMNSTRYQDTGTIIAALIIVTIRRRTQKGSAEESEEKLGVPQRLQLTYRLCSCERASVHSDAIMRLHVPVITPNAESFARARRLDLLSNNLNYQPTPVI